MRCRFAVTIPSFRPCSFRPGSRGRADALRRRVGRDELGVRLLERLQLVEERVVGGVLDLRVVEDVVAVVVVPDEAAELLDPLAGRRARPR